MNPRAPRRPRLSPGVDLSTITIRLAIGAPPIVELSGRTITGNPRLDEKSSVMVQTRHITDAGHRFIAEMAEAFGATTQPSTAAAGAHKRTN